MHNRHHYKTFEEAWEEYARFPESQISTEAEVRELYQAALCGELSEEMFRPYQNRFLLRDLYMNVVSCAVYTTEYIASLQRLLQQLSRNLEPRVLEVCAGRGVLGRLIPNWTSTDKEPASDHVQQMEAMEALDRVDADVVFASWIPHGSDLDLKLYQEWCVTRGKPLVLVTEGCGGCTGSEEFWEAAGSRIVNLSEVRGFHDVPQWHAIHDFTVAVE